jgi:murein DD-endopeptidase MepM/ murein hydrolase activator NlpD
VPQHTTTIHRARTAARAVVFAILTLSLLGLPGAPVGAETLSDRISSARARQGDLNRDIDRQNRLLAGLQQDAAAASAAIDATNRQLDGVNADQARVRKEIKAARKQLANVQERRRQLQTQVRQSDETLDLLEQEIAQGAEELTARRQALGERLADAYRTQNTSLLEQVLGADSFADVLTDASAYVAYGEQDSQMADEISQEQDALDSLRAVTAATRYRTDQLRRAAQAAADDIKTQKARLDAAMAKYQKLEHKYKALRAKQKAKAHKIAANKHEAQAYIRRKQAAQHKLNAQVAGLVRKAQAKANKMHRGGGGGGGGIHAGSGNGRFVWPTSGTITQGYGCTGFYLEPPLGSCRHFHQGIDIANSAGTPIRAAADGVVAFVGWNKYDSVDPAFIAIVAHGGGIDTWYSHMLPRYVVHAGQRVRKGQLIGYMGATGNATGPHLHWAVMRGFTSLNPYNYL